MVRHMITLKDFTADELGKIVDLGIEIKKNPEKYSTVLKDKTLIMLFQKTSTRTRCSFEAGMTQLGGHAIFLDWRTTQFQMADIQDEAKTLCRYADIIMARLKKNADLMKMAEVSTVPLINGICEKYHPTQILGDMMTIKEHLGDLKNKKLVFLGIGNNISNSLTVASTRLGMNFTLCAPEKDSPSLDQELLDEANKSGLYLEETDPKKAIEGTDAVYTDTWVNMEFFLDPKFAKEKERRIKTFSQYQLNKKLIGDSKALIMHDAPIHRGYEIDDWAVTSPNSVIFDQAENRMHIQKAIMLFLLDRL